MGRRKRGITTKLSIRLSKIARDRIQLVAHNLNLSQAGVILFALSIILKDPPSKTTLLNFENKYELESKQLPLTIHLKLSDHIDMLKEQYGMSKSSLIGLIITDYFETKIDNLLFTEQENTTPEMVGIKINSELKKKSMK